ncbi:ragulator complex protein LAMTOR3-A [Rhopalosiphum maidis]|uniref:Ragulator complex protein LAMTOR3-A n=1 Tax=Schizaphis graminum TaxID=13262 RepID=A0A2S2PJL6_SCHGA|nr:ragulator complex protein LAMTOR3-A [Rhopalosiphum maidis]XP_060853528.1 ragulator complex protein LAMTOR3-A [Rhopalosiphum padi]
MEDLRRYLYQTLTKVEGLYSILISDHDGVIILKAHANKSSEQNSNYKHSFLSEFNSASEQAGKLELGKNKTVICFYTNNQVVQLNCSRFLITFVASEKANTGNILGLEKVLEPLLKDLQAIQFP